jgi:molybdenum cofactor biosynthesis protein MoaF
MGQDVKGKTVRWTYSDGPMKGKRFEHHFTNDGTVTWKEAGAEKPSADSSARYQFVRIDDDVYVVSYLSSHGFTLTTVVDEKASTVVSFASNEKELVVQHGSLDARTRAA